MRLIKKIIYYIFFFPWLFFLIRMNFFKKFIKKKVQKFRYQNPRNIKYRIINYLFFNSFQRYFNNEDELELFISECFHNNEGYLMAKTLYERNNYSIKNLNQKYVGKYLMSELYQLFSDIEKCIIENKNKEICLVQIGSSSGRQLEYFSNKFPKINIISCDINDEIIEFQKKKYSNFIFNVSKAEDVSDVIIKNNFHKSFVIIFSLHSLMNVTKKKINLFFKNLHKLNHGKCFITEAVEKKFYKKNEIFKYRYPLSFNHNYKYWVNQYHFNLDKFYYKNPYDDEYGVYYVSFDIN